MYFKISNTAKREQMEKWTDTSFKYPYLYEPQVVINGLNEVSIPIITIDKPDEMNLAIWGMLPERYEEDWTIFQNTTNTLNLHEASMNSDLWYVDALKYRRCLIPVTGFFTSYLSEGKVYPYYISLKNNEPFYLAGVYNTLEDGFITCSLLVGKANNFIKKYQNLVDCMPLIVMSNEKDAWLDKSIPLKDIKQFLKSPVANKYQANPIAKELFNNDITYDSMLLPYQYDNS
jgi:putative SOS response-associated peptidase YedK